MATATVTKLAQSALTTAFATYYTVPAATSTVVKDIIICNTGASVRAVTICLVPSGGSAGTTNTILNAGSIGPNDVKLLQLSSVMATGDFISMKQDVGTDITVTISGVQVA